ncbi:MAG TPA: type II secretion system F family protein [Candidatus Limnocylindrales bacterium]|nr:type II secretion system F family protein [Candidatus Limnocylindrales bacterium]
MTVVLLAAAAILFALALPHPPALSAVARRLRSRGRRDIRAAIPILVDTLAAALRGGLSLSLAFAEIAPTLHPDLAVATRRVAASLSLGASVPDALAQYATVVAREDLAPLSTVLASFSRSGGRVGPSLERIAALLRGRLALEEERDALTAQSRVSAIVLVALAPLGALFFALAMPDYASTLIGDALGLVGIAIAFEIAGALWLWRIVRRIAPPPDLATFLDAVIVGLDAGLTFERALATLLERAPAFARATDARRLLADLTLGVPLAAALRAFATRPDEARVGALVAASARFGSPLAHLLVLQADALRSTERHRAETLARRLPILMLFPLATCILPALLLIFLGPPLLTLLR